MSAACQEPDTVDCVLKSKGWSASQSALVHVCNTSTFYCKILRAVTSSPHIDPCNENVMGKLKFIFLLEDFPNYVSLPFLTSLQYVGAFHAVWLSEADLCEPARVKNFKVVYLST